MLQSYHNQHQEVTTVLCLAGKNNVILSANYITAARDAMLILEPFNEAMTELSTERNTSASKIIPIVKMMMKFTTQNSSALSKKLNEMLHKRFDGIEDKTQLKLATLLDPRFKKTAFTTTESATKAVDKLKDVARNIKLTNEVETLALVQL